MIRAALAALLLTACAGETGTISIGLTTAPGSTILDGAQTLRLTVTNPRKVLTAERGSSGFQLALELEATGEPAALLVDALDGSGNLIANGASPSFPVGALTGRVIIYMAPPLSVGAAPQALAPARSELAVAPLVYGAILAGGRLDTGAPSTAVGVYNAYDHSLLAGEALPAARAGLTASVGTGNIVYLFGGTDEAGAPTANLWRFDTSVAPDGAYADYGDKSGFARTGETAVPIGNEHFLITGAPVAEFLGLDGSMIARSEVPSLPPSGVSLLGTDGMLAAIFAGASGVVRFRTGTFSELPLPAAARADAKVVALPGGKVVVVCGTTDAVRIDAASSAGETFPSVPSLAKSGCAASATSDYLVIAGGTANGSVDGTVEIYDATTLALIHTTTLVVPRTGASALALPNGQILIAGGVDANGAPTATLELFTPAN